MKLEIYSVYDSKAEAYLPPFFLANDGMATRIFESCANDSKHQFGAFPADYTLFRIGSFQDETAIITTSKTHTNLGIAIQFVNAPEIGVPHQTELKLAE